MKKPVVLLLSLSISVALVFLSTLAHAENASIQERIVAAQGVGSVKNLSVTCKEVETLWPTNPAAYFQYQDQLNATLQSLYSTNKGAKQLFEQQVELALSKKCPADITIAGGCFSAKAAIVERIANVPASASTLHMAQIIAKTLGEVRSTIISNFHWIPFSISVAPPVYPTTPLPTNGPNKGMRFMADNMDPNLIDDPVAKDAYLKAIAENESNKILDAFQCRELPHINRIMTMTFLKYTKEVFSRHHAAKKQADDLAAAAHLSEEERQQLR